jgi:hypothetical protein
VIYELGEGGFTPVCPGCGPVSLPEPKPMAQEIPFTSMVDFNPAPVGGRGPVASCPRMWWGESQAQAGAECRSDVPGPPIPDLLSQVEQTGAATATGRGYEYEFTSGARA